MLDDNPISGIGQRTRRIVWSTLLLRIAIIDQDAPAASPAPSLDIFPSVADHKTSRQIDLPLLSSLHKQAGPRFTALTAICVVMVADTYIVNRHSVTERRMDGLYHFPSLLTPGHVRLVGDDQQKETFPPQCRARFGHARKHLELVQTARRIRFPISHNGFADDSVPIEKNSNPHRQRTDSHFISANRKAGWETSKCQMTG